MFFFFLIELCISFKKYCIYNAIKLNYLFYLDRSKSSSRSSTPPPSFAECQQRPNGEHEEGSEMFEEPVEEIVSDSLLFIHDVIAGRFDILHV